MNNNNPRLYNANNTHTSTATLLATALLFTLIFVSAKTGADTQNQEPGRSVTVNFDATINGNVAWEFRPNTRSVVVTPGKNKTVSYFVKNHSNKTVATQSIPAVTPWQATKFLKKIECFCFDTQTLKAGEGKNMGLQFVIDPDLPADIDTINLSYTIMDTTPISSVEHVSKTQH